MQITTILGSAKKKGNTATVLGWVEEELNARGHDVERIYLNNKSKMISSEVVLFASPIYFWGFSSQIKTLIDRGYALVTNYHKPGHTSLMEGKRIGLLVTGADAYEENAEGMFIAFDRIVDFLLARKSGELFVGDCSVPADLPEDVKNKALELSRSLVG
jgi:multimeric flavodoxin WrbA